MKNAVTNKIRLLKHITPNPCWLKSQRNVLLLKIESFESGKKSRFSWNGLPGFIFPKLSLKPVLVSLLVLYLIFGSGLSIIQAAKSSLPGDLLYPVKIAIENVKIRIASQEVKSQLQAELVGARTQELSRIIEKTENLIENKVMVCEAVGRLQTQIINTKTQLNAMKEGEPQKVAETAKAISEQTVQSEKILVEAKEKLTEEFTEEESQEVAKVIDAAVKQVRETSVLAAELREAKGGNEVLMEVKETEPGLEILPSINEASVSFEDIKK